MTETETNDPQVQAFIDFFYSNPPKHQLEQVLLFLEDRALELDNDLLLREIASAKSLTNLL